MSALFDQQSIGKGPFITWRGQVVDDSVWRDNLNPKLHEDPQNSGKDNSSKAWGYRYKVRILGHQTEDKTNEVTDEELLMAEVMYPVTAGSGHAGSRQTPNIRMGDFVWGFFEDGLDGQRPIIMGVIGNNDNTEMYGQDPEKGFQPRTAESGLSGPIDKVADKDQLLKSQGSGKPVREGTGVNVASVADVKQALSGNEPAALPVAKKEEESEMDAIQVVIQNLLAVANKIKSSQTSFFGAATSPTKLLQAEINKAASMVAGFIKKIISKIRGAAITAIDNVVKDTVYLLFPNQRPDLNEVQNKATDTLSCVFNKIIDGLLQLILGMLKEMINNFVNAPMCAIENAVGKILGAAQSQISSALDSVFGAVDSAISGLLGSVSGVIGQVSSLAGQIADILSFFSCDENPDIPEIRQWSPFAGIKVQDPLSGPLSGILAKAGEGLGLGGAVPPCNTGPQSITNPGLIVSGGNPTVGATLNPIISPITGGIIGADVVNGGSGYASGPTILVSGNSGGSGASLSPIVENGTITGVLVNDPGSGYNEGTGSTTGPYGTPFSGPNDTVVFVPTPGPIIPSGYVTETDGYVLPEGSKVPDGTLIPAGTDLPFVVLGPSGDPIVGPGIVEEDIIISGCKVSIPAGTPLPSPTPIDIQVPSILDLPGDLMFNLPNTGYSNSQSLTSNDSILSGGWTSYPPGFTVQVSECDCVYAPVGAVIEVVDDLGNVIQEIIGQGQTVCIEVEGAGGFTTPEPGDTLDTAGDDPSDGSGQYPVVLEIKDVLISSNGYNYSEGDEIVVIPDNGAVLKPVFGNFGVLKDVEVINGGIGFNDLPTAYIKSLTGINAVIQPVFNVISIGLDAEDANQAIDIPDNATVISVVDCVGKIDQEI